MNPFPPTNHPPPHNPPPRPPLPPSSLPPLSVTAKAARPISIVWKLWSFTIIL